MCLPACLFRTGVTEGSKRFSLSLMYWSRFSKFIGGDAYVSRILQHENTGYCLDDRIKKGSLWNNSWHLGKSIKNAPLAPPPALGWYPVSPFNLGLKTTPTPWPSPIQSSRPLQLGPCPPLRVWRMSGKGEKRILNQNQRLYNSSCASHNVCLGQGCLGQERRSLAPG